MSMGNYTAVANNIEDLVPDTVTDGPAVDRYIKEFESSISGAVGSTLANDQNNTNLSETDVQKRMIIRNNYDKFQKEIAAAKKEGKPSPVPEGWNPYWYFVNQQALAEKK